MTRYFFECNDFGMSRPGIEPVTSRRSPERTLHVIGEPKYKYRWTARTSNSKAKNVIYSLWYSKI